MRLIGKHLLLGILILLALIVPVMGTAEIILTGGLDGSGARNDTWVSYNGGYTWGQINATADFPARDAHSITVLSNNSIVLSGGESETSGVYLNDVWLSGDDGDSWVHTNLTTGWPARYSAPFVTLDDDDLLFFGGSNAGGSLDDVWSSTDGSFLWGRLNASTGWAGAEVSQSGVITSKGEILSFGWNYISRSSDYGNTWYQTNASAADWAGREFYATAALPDGSIVLTGGALAWPATFTNDTWRSTDNGTSWTLMNGSSGWTKRVAHNMVTLPNGNLVLFGGQTGVGIRVNDTWMSSDRGATWTLINASSGWTERAYSASVAMLDPPASLANTVYGIVYNDYTGESVNGATVILWNGTASFTNTSFTYSGFDGVYWFENLPDSETYYINGTKTGFTPHTETVTTGPAGGPGTWTYHPVYMTPLYTLTIYVRDAESGGLIAPQVVDINIIGSYTGTVSTTTGIGTINNVPPGWLYLNVSSIGYYPAHVTYLMAGTGSITVNLTQIPDWAPYPYEHYVTFRIKDYFNTGIPNVNVSAQGYMTSTGNYDWLAIWLGLPTNIAPLNNSYMAGKTDDYGAITFLMIPTNKYYINFTHPSYKFTNMSLMPQDTEYIIYAEYNGTKLFYPETGYSELEAVNITVWTRPFNASVMFVNVSYNDTLLHTTDGYIDVLQKNATQFGAPIILKRFNITEQTTTNLWENGTEVWHLVAVSGYVDSHVVQTDYGWINRSYPFSFYSVPVSFLGFGENIALLAAFGIMLFTAMLGGASHGPQVSLVVAFEGWIFYAMHWFDALETRVVSSERVVPTVLILITLIAIFYNMQTRKKKEKN